uniref:Interferon induced protein with tetratricopeptide repeats 1B n=1 Tax=Saimiri boliviensis boliviensis TaxID=39432 RepID=A0A2K6T8J1_SAIBB
SEESDGKLIEDSLIPLRSPEIPNLENKVLEEIQFLNTKYNMPKTTQKEHANQADVRSLVTWGNFAWVYYHMGRLAEAQTYLDKVENTCKKFANPSRYRMQCPEMDCKEGWASLKCGGKNYERAKACFEKALEVDTRNEALSLHALKRAVRLNPDDVHIKVLLDEGQEAEGEKYIEEALTSMSSQTYVFRYAAKFYRRKGPVDKVLQLLKMALQATPTSALLCHQMGLCYKAQMIQIKEATNRQPRGQDRENVDRLTIMLKPTFELACVDLAEMYAEVGHHRKKVLCAKIVDDHKKQEIHYPYSSFQEHHGKSENKAITHYLKGLKTENMSYSREKLLNALEKLAKRHVHRNVRAVESFSLLGLIHKLKGEVSDAFLCYKRALRLTADLNPMF